MNNCLFCKIISGEIPCFKIYEDDFTLAFLDISKDFYGHTLVIPKVHCANILDAGADVINNVMRVVQKISKHYVENCGFDGVNILNNNNAAAHQSVFHLHVHIIPRKENDGICVYAEASANDFDLEKMQENLQLKEK